MLYGWIEVGVSNNTLFANESNQDIIVRTIYDSSKIILGNTHGLAVDAGIYIHGNNVGIQKVPSSNIQLDVQGTGRIRNMYIGYSNDYGLAVVNGPTVWQDITKHSSNVMQLVLTNSNESGVYTYNGVERVRVTDGHGITLNDTVYVTQDVYANAYQTTSDKRFKTNIVPSDASIDEEILKNIRVYDYQMQDKHVKGFLAQEIEAMYSPAISYKKGILPRFCLANYHPDVPCLQLKGSHMFAPGDEIVITHGSPSIRSIYTIKEKDETQLFLDSYAGLSPGEVTIEGQMLDDIRTVDMNQITALSTSVLQRLLTRIETLEKFVYENK